MQIAQWGWRKRWIVIGSILVVAAVIFGWQQFVRPDSTEAADLTRQVNKLIILPTNEQPAIVTVVDKSKIQNIPFLQRSAKNGDKVLVYSKAKKAILYRPSEKKIVDVGPVSIAAPPSQGKK